MRNEVKFNKVILEKKSYFSYWYITDISEGSIKGQDKRTCDLWWRTVTTVYLLLISKLYLIQGENEAHVISTLKIHWAVLNLKCRFNLASDNLPFMEMPAIWNILGWNHFIITVLGNAFPLLKFEYGTGIVVFFHFCSKVTPYKSSLN